MEIIDIFSDLPLPPPQKTTTTNKQQQQISNLLVICEHFLRSFKLCMIISLLWVYRFIPGLVTLTLFQGHKCVTVSIVRNINLGIANYIL